MQAPWLPVLLALQASTTPVSAQGPPGTTTTQFAAMKGEVDLITARRSLAGVTCGDGDRIKIQSNAALLAFAARGCTVYNGTLYLRGAADITSLEALSGLTTILNGQLYIRGLASLTSLHGLRNLRGGLADSLIIRANVMLTNLEGLEGISAIGSSGKCDEGLCMYIDDNDMLTSLKGLEGLRGTVPGGIKIQSNNALLTLNGLEGLTGVTGFDEGRGFSITIENHASLQSITALDNIQGTLPGALMVWANDNLESLQGILGITAAASQQGYEDGGAVRFSSNPKLCVTVEERMALDRLCNASKLFGQGHVDDCAPLSERDWWGPACQECPALAMTMPSARTHSSCGPGIFCDYLGGGRCMCSQGFFGAGCVTPTSTVSVLTSQFNVLEPLVGAPSDGNVLISLMRTPSTVEPTSISFAVQTGSGNATAGSDYDILPPFNNVTWSNATHGYLTLRLKVYHDIIYEPEEIFTGKLQYDPDIYQDSTLAGNLKMQFSIRDGPPGTAQFAVSEYRVSEAANDALIKLERVGGDVGAMTVTVVPVSATTTAQAREDYTFVRATITWEDGDSSPKAIAVPLTNDDIFESPDEMITLRIDHVTHKDMRGSELQETRIVIEDDQDAGICEPGRRRAMLTPSTYACLPCEADTYKSTGGNKTSCTKCPAFSSTNNILESADPSACKCQFGFVGSITGEDSMCFKCPTEATGVDDDGYVVESCHGGELMQVPRGLYKSATATPTTVPEDGYATFGLLSCRYPSNCNQTTLDVSSATECIDGSTGALCGTCKQGWILYKDGHCEACSSSSGVVKALELIGLTIFFSVFVGFEAFVAYLGAGTKYVSRVSQRRSTSSRYSSKSSGRVSPTTRSSTTRSSTTTGELAVTSVSKKNEVEDGSEVVSFKADLEGNGDVVEPAEAEKKKFGMAKTVELVYGHNDKRMGSFSDGWLVEGLDDGHPDSTAKMPITSMSIKGCYEELKSLKDVGIFSPVLRILINYSQITGLLSFVSSREFDESAGGKIMRSFSFLHVFSFTFVVDVYETIDCGMGTSVWGKTTIIAMMPVVLVAMMTLLILVLKVCSPSFGFKEWARCSGFGSMIMYTAVISGVLANLTPTEEVNGKRYLQRDTSIEYDSAGGVQAFSICYAGVFGLGFPFLLLFLYRSGLKNSKTEEDMKNTRLKYGFIAKGYSKEYFWWELLVLIRRVACIFAVVTTNDPSTQTTFVLFIIFFYTVLHLKNAPYAYGFLNMYEFVNLLCLQFSVFAQNVAYASPDNTVLNILAATVFLACQIVFLLTTISIYFCLAGVIRGKMGAWAGTSNSLPAFFMKLLAGVGMSAL